MSEIIPWLDKHDFFFPPPDQALESPDGLLAAGGDLDPKRIIAAYQQGIFPWFEEGQPILWWTPNPRTVLFPEKLHISRSLRKCLRKAPFTITADTAFERVIEACAKQRKYAEGTWITPGMKVAYSELHRQGYAHSVEAWHAGDLVGGVYGIAIGKAFFGESMFSLQSNASKVAVVHLVKQLQAWNYQIIDCQVSSAHLFTLGAEEIPRSLFQQLLVDCIDKDVENDRDIETKNHVESAGMGAPWQLTWHFDHG